MDNVIEFPGTPALADRPSVCSPEFAYIEPYPAPEFFAADIARAHVHGSVVRLTLTEPEIANEFGGAMQQICACKLIVPRESIPRLIAKLLEVAPDDFKPG